MRNTIRSAIALAVSVLIMAPVDCKAGSMTLEDALRVALENNPQIKAQDQEVSIKEMEERSQLARMLPSADVSYGYVRLNEAPSITVPLAEPLTIPMGTKDNYELSLQAKQVLFAGGALYNAYLVSKNERHASMIERERASRQLKLQVIDAYYGVIKARQMLEVAKSSMASVKSLLDMSQAFFDQGMIPKNNLLEAQVRYAETEQGLITAENAVRIAETGFNLLLARAPSDEVSIAEEIPVAKVDMTLEQAIEQAFENRQEIRVAKTQLDSAHKGVTIARSRFMPNVAATYTYTRSGEDPDVEEDSWKVGLGLSWNLFEGGAGVWGYNKASYTRAKAEYLLESLKNMVTLEVKSAYLNTLEAQARLKVAERAIDQAQENFRIEKERYSFQVSTSTDVLRAETLLAQARNNLISARADQAKAMASLLASMGTL